MLTLEYPTLEDREEIIRIINEYYEENADFKTLHGASFYGGTFNFDEWLESSIKYRENNDIPSEHVPASQYLIKDDGEIVGFVNIRHKLNDYLRAQGGHIGYSVIPSKRKRGYASFGLKTALKECKKLGIENALVTCDDDNLASYKTIEKCNGVLDSVFEGNGEKVRRYYIKI